MQGGSRDLVEGFWTLLAIGAFYIHPTARNHDEIDEDGFFPGKVRPVKAPYAQHVNEDKQDDPNREFVSKCVCTVSNQTCHARMVGALALLIGSGHTCAPTTIEKSAMFEMKV